MEEIEDKGTTTTVVAEDEIKLDYVDEQLVRDVMATPTSSKHEFRMVSFIVLWARKNDIDYELDDYGNVYLTKGELAEGEFYPCVTSHMDTVQDKQTPYAQAGANLELITKINTEGKHELHLDNIGIGADCKAGIAICLNIFKHVDKLKACFFLEEEIGCIGSKHMNKDWFKDVGYVIGYDSPDLNRAAWACSGVKLFDKDFFKTKLKDTCKKWGLDKFHSEPYTDVKVIREETSIVCMNFGNGGYLAHNQTSEYCILEEMDNACGMGIDLIKNSLGNEEYKIKSSNVSYTYDKDSDESYFNSLTGETTSYSGYNSYSYGGTSSYYSSSSTTSTTKSTEVDSKCVEHVANTYEKYIASIKEKISEKCKELDIDESEFAEIFNSEIKF